MPPLVSEDPEDFTEDSLATSRAEYPEKLEQTLSRPETPKAQADPQHAEAHKTQNMHVVDIADDSDLIAQLQRSAQEADAEADESERTETRSVNEASVELPDRASGADDGDGDVVIEDSKAEEEQQQVGSATPSVGGDEDESQAAESPVADSSSSGSGSDEGSDEDAEEDEKAAEVETEQEEDEDDEDNDDEEEEEAEDSSSDSDEENNGSISKCLFCDKTIDDPESATQAQISCSGCSSLAHQVCADEVNGYASDKEPAQWRCPTCVKGPDSESPKSVLARARASNSAPRLVRDLLPVSRGIQKPNAHSIFEQPLISDGEDGGRSLRKRKSPTQEPPPTDKRRKKTSAAGDQIIVEATPKDRAVAHSTRSAMQPSRTVPLARILQHRPFHKPPPHKFILAFRLGQEAIAEILKKPPKPGRRARKQKPPRIPPPPVYQPPIPKFPALPSGNLVFPSLFSDRESDAKPYGGILSDQEADTSRSLPQHRDREIFEIARKEAEEERQRASEAAEAEINGDIAGTGKPNRTVSGPPSKIKCIQFGKFVIDTFYAAPYPEEYSHESRLFICEFCLKYLPSEFVAYRHKLKCPAKHPPGDEIYRDGSISIWEVDGRKKTEYCQCLCLMAKMFLGSKTLYYDVEPFLFYILTEHDETGYHFVGYFSKEKRPASQNNVSCILVMPIHQRKGYATFLIDFSYLLTRIEEKDGSPEKPLSDMGLTAYRAYWDLTISRHLLDLGMKPFSTKTLMARTGMTADDVIHSLERLYAFTRDPVTKTYAIRYDKRLYESIVNEFDSKKHRRLRPERLIWTPYVMGRSDQAHLDGQPMATIAPREEDIEDEDESQGKSGIVTEAVSPKTISVQPSRAATEQGEEPSEAVTPGPPPTDLLDTVPVDMPKTNGDVKETMGEFLTGYALAYRTHNVPPMRFQITPPIPAAMLRNRSTKKRTAATAFGRLNANGQSGKASSSAALATRSSPRTAGGSVNGRSSRGGSEDKNLTPVRRSGRKSGLANVELASLDGQNDKENEDDEDSDVMEIEVARPGEVSSEASDEEEGSSEEEEEEEVEDDDDQDPDVEVDDDEEETSSADEEDEAGDDDAGSAAAEVLELTQDQDEESEDEGDADAEEAEDDAPGEDDEEGIEEDEDEDAPGELDE